LDEWLDDLSVCAGPAGVGGGADPKEGDVVGGGDGEGVFASLLSEDVAAVVDSDIFGGGGGVTVDVGDLFSVS